MKEAYIYRGSIDRLCRHAYRHFMTSISKNFKRNDKIDNDIKMRAIDITVNRTPSILSLIGQRRYSIYWRHAISSKPASGRALASSYMMARI